MTLGARMACRDRDAFVGRRRELAELGSLFVDDPAASVVLLHGAGGSGRSARVRERGRRGRDAVWTPVAVEGGDLPPVPDALEAALAPARRVERPLSAPCSRRPPSTPSEPPRTNSCCAGCWCTATSIPLRATSRRRATAGGARPDR